MKNVLYITYDGLTDPLGQSQILPYLKELTKEGFQITILSFEKKNRFEKEKEIVYKVVDSSRINWIPLQFTSNPPVLSKIFDRWKLKQRAFRICRKEKFDAIHCRSYVASEIGLKIKREFKIPFLFDMRGFWADEKVDNGQWDQKHFFYRFIYRYYKRKERAFLLNADAIITLTQAARDYLLSQPGFEHLVIDVIPCCADMDYFDYHNISPEKISSVKSDLKIPGTAKVLTYSGSIGGWYLTKDMFTFFKMLTELDPDYVMLILSKDDAAKIAAEAMASGIPKNKVFITYSDRNHLPAFLALSTVGIFFIRNTFSKMASSPTKHAELMAMGIPVICNAIGDTGSIVKDTKTGIVVDELTKNSFQNALKGIKELEEINKELIRASAFSRFDLALGIRKYSEIYNRIMN